MRRSRDLVFSIGALAVAAVFWVEASNSRYESALFEGFGLNALQFPRALLTLWTVLAGILLLGALLKPAASGGPVDWKPAMFTIAGTFAYFFLMVYLGFILASVVFVLVMPFLLGYRNVPVILIMSIAVPVAVWLTFVHLLQIQLPRSPWFAIF
ncbi:tripartite tricarboxylate transporter TctB family protein [Defluviimonas sp. SAOS-178_SWC]|uniref:tripartite tricarboxylate transporter TctB family protein n=1 Tax=Defluviimonas sp. SAOS-178_SWC TaxID=3121287 RepID=UPI0032219BAA